MEIKVLFFAQLRDLFGVSETTLNVSEGTNVQQVVGEIVKGKEFTGFDWTRIQYAVNEDFSEMSRILHDQDTLVFLPPVSGG